MKPLLAAFALSSVFAAFVGQSTPPAALATGAAALKKAPGLSAKFTVIRPGGEAIQGTLLYGKPGHFRIETQDRAIVSDGTNQWTLDKKANSYVEGKASLAPTSEDDVWPWATFFAEEPFKGAQSFTAGAKRMIKANAVQEWKVKYADREATLYVDQKTGEFRGGQIVRGPKETLIVASELAVLAEAPAADKFAFQPMGAKKQEAAAPAAGATFAMVQPILNMSCVGCHNGPGGKAGVDLSSLQAILRSPGLVTPGDPDNSGLVSVVSGPRPRMPRGGSPLSAAQVATLRDWIKAGAK